MNKKTLLVVALLIALVLSAVSYAYFDTKDKNTSPVATSTQEKTPVTSQPESLSKETKPGSYIDYRADLIGSTIGTKLLFFHAPWCSQCRAIDADIKSDGVPENVTVFKVDYDSNQSLRAKYGVTLQTTFVKINDSGEKIQNYVAYDEPNFDSVKRKLLP